MPLSTGSCLFPDIHLSRPSMQFMSCCPSMQSGLCMCMSRLTKTQRRLMRRSERRAAQRSGPEAQDGSPESMMDACLQQELGTLPEEEDSPPEELHDPSPSAMDGEFLTSIAQVTHHSFFRLVAMCCIAVASRVFSASRL